MKPARTCACVLLAIWLIGIGWPEAARESPPNGTTTGLSTIWSLNSGVVRDGNGDGLADMVAARIVMPATATVREIQGASNIAARLGFETTALDDAARRARW